MGVGFKKVFAKEKCLLWRFYCICKIISLKNGHSSQQKIILTYKDKKLSFSRKLKFKTQKFNTKTTV